MTLPPWRKTPTGSWLTATPATPPGMAMLRTSYMATHEEEHLAKIVTVFEKLGKKLGLLDGVNTAH